MKTKIELYKRIFTTPARLLAPGVLAVFLSGCSADDIPMSVRKIVGGIVAVFIIAAIGGTMKK